MEQVNSKKICIVIISKNDDIENVKSTIENLKQNGCKTNQYIVATEKENSKETIEYCSKNKIEYYEYKNQNEIYYTLPTKLEFDYFSFINCGDKYTENFVEKFYTIISLGTKSNLYITPIIYEDSNYKLNKNLAKIKSVNIEKNPEKIWINLKSAFISKNLIKQIKEDNNEDLNFYAEKVFLLKVIAKNGGYQIIRNIKLISKNYLEDSREARLENYDILWYKNIFNAIKSLNKFSVATYTNVLEFIQYSYMYLIKNILNENANTKNKHIIIDNLKEEFYASLKKVLEKTNDEIIVKNRGNKLINYYLLNLKYGKTEPEYKFFNAAICIENNNKIIFNAEDEIIKILTMDYKDGNILITARYPFPFDDSKLNIVIKYNNKTIKVHKNPLYSEYRLFGEKIYDEYVFDAKIPLKRSSEKRYIEFFIQNIEGTSEVKLDIGFIKPTSKLTKLKNSYWDCNNYTLNYRNKSLMVLNNSKLRHVKRELKCVTSLILNKNKTVKKAGWLRFIYNLTKPFFKKEIWLFEDKIFKGGDNGEYLYSYACKQKDRIKKYYVLDKNSIDAKRFRKEKKKFLNYGTLKHKLLFLNSNIVFETHNSATKHHAFDDDIEKYFRDLYKSDNVCIQHGLSVQYIPHLVNRINDNLKMFFLASPVEEQNLKNKEYAYEGYEDVLRITGSPRYDGLKNNDKKQILITPTWRNYLAMPATNIASSRSKNNNFKNSNYFKIYNKLINSKKLIETAKQTGYKIIYLLHPCTSPQIDDFDKNKYVELIAATDNLNYEKILTESSLMVTDYSGVQFDFAYMYKPIIYFHPEELPPSYDEGEYKYNTMALGEIVKKSDELVDMLCDYMRNDCKIKEEYKGRIDKFFKFHDYNNCKRIYEDVINYRNEEK